MPARASAIDVTLDQRLAAHREQRLGDGVGQGAQPLAAPGREYHGDAGPFGCRAHASARCCAR